MKLDDLLPILGVEQYRDIKRDRVIDLAIQLATSPDKHYANFKPMNDAVVGSYALYWFLHPTHKKLGTEVIDNLHHYFTPLRGYGGEDRAVGIIMREEDKLGMNDPYRDFSKASPETKVRFHLLQRANQGTISWRAEQIYQALLHAPLIAISTDPQRAKRVEEIYQTFSRMPAHLF